MVELASKPEIIHIVLTIPVLGRFPAKYIHAASPPHAPIVHGVPDPPRCGVSHTPHPNHARVDRDLRARYQPLTAKPSFFQRPRGFAATCTHRARSARSTTLPRQSHATPKSHQGGSRSQSAMSTPHGEAVIPLSKGHAASPPHAPIVHGVPDPPRCRVSHTPPPNHAKVDRDLRARC